MAAARGNALKPLRVLALTKYCRLGASSRMRTLQYLPWFQEAGLDVTVQALLGDNQLQARYGRGKYGYWALLDAYAQRVKALLGRHSFDVLWIEKEALQWWPLWAERALLRGVPYVLDYDDAVFHSYDMHTNALVRHVFGRRLDGLMAGARLVVAGNEYLAQRARSAGAPWVEVVPTAVDLERYPAPGAAKSSASDGLPRVVWIGSPSTVKYLQLIAATLQTLAQRRSFVLRVIGGGAVDIPGLQTEVVDWSEATEVKALQSADVGVMPLEDTPWERGKCGYKLIQYMACGLPVIGSAVSANNDIVVHGQTGMLARSADNWLESLEALLADAALRQQMGQAGRVRAEGLYCIQQTGPRLAGLLKKTIQGMDRCAE